MKFVVITKSHLDYIPPVISVAFILNDLGHSIRILTAGASESIVKQMQIRNIAVDIYPYTNAQNFIGKVYEYLKFRNVVKQRLKELEFDYLWIEGAITIRSLGVFIKDYKYILQISELHDDSSKQLKAISKVIKEAKLVFMPEFNRTILYQVWFNLNKRPITLPNKPYFIPSSSSLASLQLKYSKLLDMFSRYKVILYQGMIFPERDLSNYIRAIKELGDEYRLVLLGRDDNMLDKYRQIDKSLIHIEFIPAPDYLIFTSLCHIGVVTYDPRKLNTAYCAPNKIYEYSAFGKPMLGNKIPGLFGLEQHKAGVLVDEDDITSIKNAILRLDKEYDTFSSGAERFFYSTNNVQTIKASLEKLQ